MSDEIITVKKRSEWSSRIRTAISVLRGHSVLFNMAVARDPYGKTRVHPLSDDTAIVGCFFGDGDYTICGKSPFALRNIAKMADTEPR